MSEDKTTLRRKALEGSVYLSVRRAIGIFLSIIALIFITRAVGPAAYGLFAAASSLFGYAQYIGRAGIRVYLIRETRDNSTSIFHQSFTLNFLWGTIITFVSLVILYISSIIVKDFSNLALVSACLLLMLLPVAVSEVPLAIIEYRLEHKKISLIELTAHAMFCIVGIALAQLGAGVWALVSAFWVMQIVSVVGIFWAAEYRPRWEWNFHQIRNIFKESFKIGFAQWIYELRLLTTPLVLLPLTNETVVGYYALAERLRGVLDIWKMPIERLSLPLYARAKTQSAKLLELVRLSSLAQMIGLAFFYIPTLLFGRKIFVYLFGGKWDISLIFLTLAIIGSNQLFFVTFGALNQALLVVKQAHVFAKSGGAYVVCSFALSALLVILMPEPHKLLGYALGISLAYVPTYYWMMHVNTARYIGKPRYGMNLIWATGLGAAMFAPFTGYWSLLGLLVFLHPASLHATREIVGLLREARGAKNGAVQE